MIRNFWGKGLKDIERASDTVISGAAFTNNILNRINENSPLSISNQQSSSESYDGITEKKNKE